MGITRIILAKGAVETLEYFSMQMAKAFEEAGLCVWFWDMKKPTGSREAFEEFYRREETVFLTFNFIGLSGESQFEWRKHRSVWDCLEIPCFCIMVDHPMYYYKQLSSKHTQLTLLCIDRGHARFVEEYYPVYGKVSFLPLGGTELLTKHIPYADRKYDVVFAGNYVALSNLTKHLDSVEEENKEFYFEIIEHLIKQPDLSMDKAILLHLKNEFPKITRSEILACMYGMIFVDLYVRSYFRREIVCSLAESGIKVTVLGKDWELAKCLAPENIVMTGQVDSKTCLKYMQNARISLNIMPWFKEGTHDRIFNSMLQGCVAVTDASEYILEKLEEGREYAGFSLKEREKLPDMIKELLADEKRAAQIAENGYKKAAKEHQWKQRAEEFLEIVRSLSD